MNWYKNNGIYSLRNGFTLVELIVSAAIILTGVVAIVSTLQFFIIFSRQTSQKTHAALLLEEGLEALVLLRDLGWDENIDPLVEDTTYYLYREGVAYYATTSPVVINNMYRTLEAQYIFRNGSDAIDESGTLDPNTRKMIVRIKSIDNEVLLSGEMLVHNSYEN